MGTSLSEAFSGISRSTQRSTDEATGVGGKNVGTRSRRRKKRAPIIRSKRGLLSARDLRLRIEAAGLSIRQVAKATGLNHRTLGRYLTGEIAIPQWLDVALKSLELEKALVALIAETKPRAQVPKMKLVALVERFVPPAPKVEKPAKVKAPLKVAKPPVKPRRKVYVAKTYDASIRYQRPVEEPHPITSGFKTHII
jgi:transcriptional regulator with XRE-family HTH domain